MSNNGNFYNQKLEQASLLTCVCINKQYEYLCANKLSNLDEIDKFSGKHKVPKVTQEKTVNINTSKKTKEIKQIILYINLL